MTPEKRSRLDDDICDDDICDDNDLPLDLSVNKSWNSICEAPTCCFVDISNSNPVAAIRSIADSFLAHPNSLDIGASAPTSSFIHISNSNPVAAIRSITDSFLAHPNSLDVGASAPTSSFVDLSNSNPVAPICSISNSFLAHPNEAPTPSFIHISNSNPVAAIRSITNNFLAHPNEAPTPSFIDKSNSNPVTPIRSITNNFLAHPNESPTPSFIHKSNSNPGAPIRSISDSFLAIECKLAVKVRKINFAQPVAYIYNSIEYAFEIHANYVRKFCRDKKRLLFLGMNPGPWGMSQTGVPFGAVNVVRDWLELTGFIGKPLREHPARKVMGFACTRTEVSGMRFWSLVRKLCLTPQTFFRHSFLHNYCPLALMDEAGRNITPAELKGPEQKTLLDFCDDALVAVIQLLGIEKVVCVGRFTEKRARAVVAKAGLATDILYVAHPSPRSPTNVNWVENTTEKLRELNLLRFFTEDCHPRDYNDNNS